MFWTRLSWIIQTRNRLRTIIKVFRVRHGTSFTLIHYLWRIASYWRRNVLVLQRQHRIRELKLSIFKLMNCENTVSSFRQSNCWEENWSFKMRSFVRSLVIHFCFCQRRNSWKSQCSFRFINQDFYLKVSCNLTPVFKTRFIIISVSFSWKRPALNIFSNIVWGIKRWISLLICLNKSHKYFAIPF